MTVTQLLFGFKGRLKRLSWWIATILADLGLGIVDAIFGVPRPSVFFLLLLVPPLIWISIAVQVKRWHDRDKIGLVVFDEPFADHRVAMGIDRMRVFKRNRRIESIRRRNIAVEQPDALAVFAEITRPL